MRAKYTRMEQLRSYSSVFSRRVFSDIIDYADFSRLNTVYGRYDFRKTQFLTYFDYIKYLYRTIAKEYRCEYVYKNELINKLLITQYGTRNTVAISEFRVSNSIVDVAMFNGESKAFEIKTQYDTKRRLDGQIEDYSKLFQKCYVVIPEESYQEYVQCIPDKVGIIVLIRDKGRIRLEEKKEAIANKQIDVGILMRSVRASEYRNIVLEYFGKLPEVSCFEMFEQCQDLIEQIPDQDLQKLFLVEMKKRVNCTKKLQAFPKEIRQMCLSMNLDERQANCLLDRLNTIIER